MYRVANLCIAHRYLLDNPHPYLHNWQPLVHNLKSLDSILRCNYPKALRLPRVHFYGSATGIRELKSAIRYITPVSADFHSR